MKQQIPMNKCISSSAADRRHATPTLVLACVGLLCVGFATATSHAQTLLSETTWGGEGSDTSEGVATAPDGMSYVVGGEDRTKLPDHRDRVERIGMRPLA